MLELHQVIDDAPYSIDHQSYPADELAVRFHHRLVAAHRFPAATAGGPALQAICWSSRKAPRVSRRERIVVGFAAAFHRMTKRSYALD